MYIPTQDDNICEKLELKLTPRVIISLLPLTPGREVGLAMYNYIYVLALHVVHNHTV